MPTTLNRRRVIAKIQREVHLTDGLKAKLLISIDIIGLEGIAIDIPYRSITTYSCANAKVNIKVTVKDIEKVNRTVQTAERTTVPLMLTIALAVLIDKPLPPGRDYKFEPY